jgi:hypothetical protein
MCCGSFIRKMVGDGGSEKRSAVTVKSVVSNWR